MWPASEDRGREQASVDSLSLNLKAPLSVPLWALSAFCRPMAHKRKHPRTFGRFVSDEVRATNEVVDHLRSSDAAIFEADLHLGKSAADESRLLAIEECRRTLESAHQDDPLRKFSELRLKILTSAWYPYYQSFLLHLKGGVRLLCRELLYASMIPRKFLIIVVCNVIWFGFLFWLITS